MFTTWCTWRQHNTEYLKICEEGESYVGYLLFMINWIFLFIRKTQSKKKNSFSCGKEKEEPPWSLRSTFLSLLSTIYLNLPSGSSIATAPSEVWPCHTEGRLFVGFVSTSFTVKSVVLSTMGTPGRHSAKDWVNNPIILIFHLYWLTLGGKAQTCLTNAFKLLPLVLLEEWRHSYKYFKA